MEVFELPKQKIPSSQKNDDWKEHSVDAIINKSVDSFSAGSEIEELFDAYKGKINRSKYRYVEDPYKWEEKGKSWRYPARLRNYNIIKPVVDLLLGEQDRRPFNWQVTVKNPDTNEKARKDKQALIQILRQMFINAANKAGMNTNMQTKETEDPKTVKEMQRRTISDQRAIDGQDALEYLFYHLRLPEKFKLAFYYWVVTGTIITFKDEAFGDVEYEVIDPREISYEQTPNTQRIEDSGWVVRHTQMTLNQVVDNFRDILTDDQIEFLEYPALSSSRGFVPVNATEARPSDDLVEVYHSVWRSFKKVGILSYVDELGQIQQMEVSDNYKFSEENGDVEIEWEWRSEIWHGYRFDEEIYAGIEPYPVQRNDMANPSKNKLPYNGQRYDLMNTETMSVVKMGLPYQMLYNIFHYRLELSLAKNKDKILLMEINTIPKRHGWDKDTFQYHADAAGVAYIDTTADGKDGKSLSGFNQYQVLDMGLGDYIEKQFELLSAIKSEWEESLGINRQRKGNIMASDGQGTSERAVFQSSIMTEDLFTRFDQFKESELQGLLDVSKYAWADGKKGTYTRSDGQVALLALDPESYQSADFGVFVTQSGEESSKLSAIKQLAQQFASAGSNPATVSEILDAGNFTKVKDKLKEVQEAEQAWEREMNQMKMKEKEKELEIKREEREDQQEHEASENEKDRQKEMTLKQMEIEADLIAQDDNNNGVSDLKELQKNQLEREKFEHEKRMDEKSSEVKEKELNIKDKQVDNQLKIAKTNKNKYDKKR